MTGVTAIETGVPAALCIRHMEDFVNRIEGADSFEVLRALAEIAGYLAFTSQNYFQTVFKQAEGCTPLEYRLKHR